jgi:hypothetical protein
MPLVTSQPDPILVITGPSGSITFGGFEIPEFIHVGGPFRAIVHKQPGGTRQIDSMGPDPDPIKWDGIFLSADGYTRARALYAMYEAGDKVTVKWTGWSRDCVITHFTLRYKANNYVEYAIELTEVTVIPTGVLIGVDQSTLQGLLKGASNVPSGGGGLG